MSSGLIADRTDTLCDAEEVLDVELAKGTAGVKLETLLSRTHALARPMKMSDFMFFGGREGKAYHLDHRTSKLWMTRWLLSTQTDVDWGRTAENTASLQISLSKLNIF